MTKTDSSANMSPLDYFIDSELLYINEIENFWSWQQNIPLLELLWSNQSRMSTVKTVIDSQIPHDKNILLKTKFSF